MNISISFLPIWHFSVNRLMNHRFFLFKIVLSDFHVRIVVVLHQFCRFCSSNFFFCIYFFIKLFMAQRNVFCFFFVHERSRLQPWTLAHKIKVMNKQKSADRQTLPEAGEQWSCHIWSPGGHLLEQLSLSPHFLPSQTVETIVWRYLGEERDRR